MKKVIALIIAMALILSLSAPVFAAKPEDSPWRTTPDNLPILKMPWTSGAKGGIPGPPSDNGKPEKPSPPSEVNKWALVIGISDYPGVSSDLFNADDDALAMRDALITVYGFPEDNIKLLVDRKAKARSILGAIEWLADREDADSSVIVFFCGHGFRRPETENWDSDVEADGYDEGIVSWDMYGLPDGMLEEKFSTFETSQLTLIFGSCFAGGMFDDDSDLQKVGRVIPVGCKVQQSCWDYRDLGNTLFGYYFIYEGIIQLEADLDGDDQVSMEEAFAYAYTGVTSHVPAPPEPQEPDIADMYLTLPDYAEELVP